MDCTGLRMLMIPFSLSSNLNHTWFIDIDGTVFKHNGYKDYKDELLPRVKEFWDSIPKDDIIVMVTGRPEEYRDFTEKNLKSFRLRYDHILFGLAIGERILINDVKPEGLKTAIAWNVNRDEGFSV